jgi:histidinol-phosphate aminotransferase
MSKAFALANFRVGYLIASKDNVQFINKIRNPKNLTTFGQEAATAALEDYQYMQSYVKEVKAAQLWFKTELEKKFPKKMKPIDSGGNFTMIVFPDYDEKVALINYLADNNIFVRDCTQGPSVKNCFRITIGTKPQMERVLSVITQFYKG